jgi:hypothetical protein
MIRSLPILGEGAVVCGSKKVVVRVSAINGLLTTAPPSETPGFNGDKNSHSFIGTRSSDIYMSRILLQAKRTLWRIRFYYGLRLDG